MINQPVSSTYLTPANSKSQVTVGHARFTVISPNCIRMEYAPRHGFVDDPSLLAANRSARWDEVRITQTDALVTLDTCQLCMEYRPDGLPFSTTNLRVTFRNGEDSAEWTPDSKNTGNLGGPVPTLDGWDGPRDLPDGLLSRDGWFLLDDSGQPLLKDGWILQRPGGIGSQSKGHKEFAVNADLDWYLYAYGSDYKSAFRALAALSGQVPMPRRHILGSWYCRWHPYTAEQFRKIVADYEEHDFPLDILVMDMDWHTQSDARTGFGHAKNLGWTGYTWNKHLLPEPEKLLQDLREDGIFVTLNDHPCDGMREHEEHYSDFIERLPDRTSTNPPFDAGDRRYMDAFFQSAHEPLEYQGVDFWWLDWQQDHIYNAVHGVPGLKHLPWLNHLYYQHSLRGNRRGQAFSRWGGWGDHRNPIQFSGDTISTWEMLAFQIPFTALSGNAGCFFWAHDLGGFSGDRNPEMFTRWVQFGALSPSLRLHSCGDHLDRRPWLWGERFETAMRSAYKLRCSLIPYIYTSVRQCHQLTLPLVRPMYLEYPETPQAYENPQQYFFGDSLLAAPITSPRNGTDFVATQKIWFPEGTWFNLLSHEKFEGDRTVTVQANIDEIPVFAKGGVPIPMQPYTQRMTTTPLSTLIVRCYPGTSGSATLYEDDGQTQGYLHGAFATTDLAYQRVAEVVTITIGAARGTYEGQPNARSYEIELTGIETPVEASFSGRPIPIEFDFERHFHKIMIPAQLISEGIEIILKNGKPVSNLALS
jgi:alpha-glucosidase (family GH31 glycosyl hydrolase)